MRIALLIATAAIAMSFQQLQTKGTVQQTQPVITGVQTTMAYEPGAVNISGRNFDMVTQVKIDGQAVPILDKSGNQLVIRRDLANPGFASLELVGPRFTVPGTIEFAPSLRGARTANNLHVVVNPVEPGSIWIDWSFRTLQTPSNLPGVYYPLMLDLTAPQSGRLCSEVSLTGEPVVVDMPIPMSGGMFDNLELRRIATCRRSASSATPPTSATPTWRSCSPARSRAAVSPRESDLSPAVTLTERRLAAGTETSKESRPEPET
jgi:hypothetical protein